MRNFSAYWFSFAVFVLPISLAAGTLGSAFTYQGKLEQGGVDVTETCDFNFGLWDAAAGGAQVAAAIDALNVQVTDGTFTVELNYGAGVFEGDARWLEIAVACPAGGGLTTLAPRQELTPSPNALFAAKAGATEWASVLNVPADIANGDDVDDADADPANELQDLGLSGNTLSLTGDATPVDLSGYLDNTDNQTLAEVLAEGNNAGGASITNIATTTTGALTISGLDCTGNANGGALTTNGSGVVSCSDDDAGAGGGNTLDQAYDQGGAGAGRTITADSGSVMIDGPDGLTLDSGSLLQLAGDPVLVGSLPIGSNPTNVFVSGRYIYVVDGGSSDLKVIDASDPTAPGVVGNLGIGSFPTSVYVSGRYAYVVDEVSSDLKVIDVSDPSAPILVGSLVLGVGALPSSVHVSGPYAYIVDVDSDDLKVIDVSDPATPSLAGSIGLGSSPSSVFVAGRYAFVVDQGSDDLKVIDVSNPRAPSLAGSLGIGADPVSLRVSGRYAYVVDSSSNDLKVIDVSDPGAPTLAGSLGVGVGPTSVYVSGRYAYVILSGADDLRVIDVSDPGMPVLAGTLGIGAFPISLSVAGRYAYVVDLTADDLKVIDVSGAEVNGLVAHSLEAGSLQVRNDMTAQGQLQVAGGVNVGPGGVFSDGDVGVAGGLTLNSGSLQQTPGDPLLVGSLGIGGQPISIQVSGRYAYVVDQSSTDLKVIDVTQPNAPSLSGSVALLSPVSIHVSGRYAYVADAGTNDLKIIDVSDPSAPAVTGTLVIGDQPRSVQVSGRYAYVVDSGSDDLKVIDVADPLAPSLTGSVAIGALPISVYVSGRFAYVIDFTDADLKVIDVANPAAPSVVGTYVVGGTPRAVRVSGRYAYISDSTSENLIIVDVSDPATPSLAGSITLDFPNQVYVSGRYAYVTNLFSNNLHVVDVSDPSMPLVAGTLDVGGVVSSLQVSGRYAYLVGTDFDELRIIDVTGAEVSSLTAHALEAGNLQVRNDVIAQGQLQVTGGVNVGSGGLFSDGNVGISGTIAIANDIAPTTSPANLVQLYAEDVADSSELKVRDEAGNVTTLSPHNFSLVGEPSEPMAWSFYSENDHGAINVDMLRAMRLIERMSGEKLVYIEPGEATRSSPFADAELDDDGSIVRNMVDQQNGYRELMEAVRALAAQKDAQIRQLKADNKAMHDRLEALERRMN